jgi:hypothetical protein
VQEKTFAFLLDLGLGQRIEVGEDVGPRSRMAEIGGAVRGVAGAVRRRRASERVEVTEDEDGEVMGFQQIATRAIR